MKTDERPPRHVWLRMSEFAGTYWSATEGRGVGPYVLLTDGACVVRREVLLPLINPSQYTAFDVIEAREEIRAALGTDEHQEPESKEKTDG